MVTSKYSPFIQTLLAGLLFLGNLLKVYACTWVKVKVFRITCDPEFRILRLTFHITSQNAELGRIK